MKQKDDTMVKGKRIFLRLLTTDDVILQYVEWLQDPEVVQFLESRWRPHCLGDIKKYVKQMNSSRNNFLLGIFLDRTKEHIGNIKIGNIDYNHRFGEIGLLIGNKRLWGEGYGSEAIKLATQFAFKDLDLVKLIAGIYANNKGSYKAFLKCGFRRAGTLKKHRIFKNRYVDEFIVEKRRE